MADQVVARAPAVELRDLWSPVAGSDDPVLHLITGRDDLSRWSEDVARAVLAFVAFLREWQGRIDTPRRGRPLHGRLYTLVRVEMTRDLLARVPKTGRRLSRAEVLALLYVGSLRTREPKTARSILRWTDYYQEQGNGLPRAVVSAVRHVDGRRFNTLESKLSQAPAQFAQDDVTIARFWRNEPRTATESPNVRAV